MSPTAEDGGSEQPDRRVGLHPARMEVVAGRHFKGYLLILHLICNFPLPLAYLLLGIVNSCVAVGMQRTFTACFAAP